MDACIDIPRDELDSSFTKSFNHQTESSQALQFFDDYGFVVFNSIYSADECATTRDAMWKVVESEYPGLNRSDMETWNLYKSTGKYGMSMRGPCFDPVLVRNRCNRNLTAALKVLIGNDVMVSQDRYTIFRATISGSGSGSGSDSDSNSDSILPSAATDGSAASEAVLMDSAAASRYDQFRTGERNIHLDLNPWWFFEPYSQHSVIRGINSLQYEDPHDFIKENNYVVGSMGLHVQCILNYADNRSEDGGTVLCPKFHHHMKQWCCRENPSVSDADTNTKLNAGDFANNIHLRGNMPWVTFDRFPPSVKATAAMSATVEDVAAPSVLAALGESQVERSAGNTTYPRKQKVNQKQKQVQQNLLKQQLMHELEDRAHAQLLAVCHRVPMRAGSVLIWNQLLFHGTSPNISKNCRFAQYIKAFPRNYDQRLPNSPDHDSGHFNFWSSVDSNDVKPSDGSFADYSEDHKARLHRRARALYRELRKANYFEAMDPEGIVSDITSLSVTDAISDGQQPTSGDEVDQKLLRSMDTDALRLFGLDVLLN